MDLLVLEALRDGERYGYDIVRSLTDAGLQHLNEATVYGTLRRLEAARFLHSQRVPVDGRLRRYYELSPAGVARLDDLRTEWCELSTVVAKVSVAPEERQSDRAHR